MLGSIGLVLLGFVLGVALAGLMAVIIIGAIYREAVEMVESRTGFAFMRSFEPAAFGGPRHDPV